MQPQPISQAQPPAERQPSPADQAKAEAIKATGEKPSQSPLTPSSKPSDKPDSADPEAGADKPGVVDAPARTGPADPTRTELIANPADKASPELPGLPDVPKPAPTDRVSPLMVPPAEPPAVSPPMTELPAGSTRRAVGGIEIGNQDGPLQRPQPSIPATAPAPALSPQQKQALAEVAPERRQVKAETGAVVGLVDVPGAAVRPSAMPSAFVSEMLKYVPTLNFAAESFSTPRSVAVVSGVPSPAGQRGLGGGTSVGGGEPGQQSDKESDAFSTRSGEFRNGRVEAGEGIEIKTVRPQFGLITRTIATPRSPRVEIAFDRAGFVKRAKILQSSGYPAAVDEPILDAVYQWRAIGESLSQLPNQPDAELRLVLTVYLR